MTMLRTALALYAIVGGVLAVTSAAQAAPAEAHATAPVDQAGWNAQKRRATLSNGVELAYVELGNPTGKPLLLLHGYTDTSRSWSLLVPYLKRFRLIIPDQRGHGASEAPRCCYGTMQMADDARLLLDELKIERAAVAGHSMGSMVAIALAADQPARVERIILIGSTALPPIRRGDWLWTNVSGLKWPLDRNSEFLREWNPANQPTPVDAVFAEAAMEEILAIEQHVWLGVMRELAEVPVARHAADIRAPALVLSGGADPLFPAEHHQALVKAVPGAVGQVYPGLGHNFLWEQPETVARKMTEFIDQ